jgi:putative membrane protein
MNIVSLAIAWLVMSVSFFIISKLPLGVEIDSFGKAMMSAAVFGLLNVVVQPLVTGLSLPLIWLTFGLFMVVVNAIIFGLAAWLVDGFRLRHGVWSALIGAMALGFINSFLYKMLGPMLTFGR